MKLLSSWRRWEIFLTEENWKVYAIKKAKDSTKKWAIKKEIVILTYLKDKVSFVPKIVDWGDDWFKYEFIPWKTLDKVKLDINSQKKNYKKLIEYAFKLDLLNVEHWELSRPTKNIIVNNSELFIIDFERWNLMNKSFKNIKALWQFFAWLWFVNFEKLKKIKPEELKTFLTKQIDLL